MQIVRRTPSLNLVYNIVHTVRHDQALAGYRNKRTALNAAIAFLGLNGFDVIDPDGKLFAAMIGLNTGEWTKLQMAARLEQLASPWKGHD